MDRPNPLDHALDSLSAWAPYITGALLVMILIGLYFQARRKDADAFHIGAYLASTMTMAGILNYALTEQSMVAAVVALAFSTFALMSLKGRA